MYALWQPKWRVDGQVLCTVSVLYSSCSADMALNAFQNVAREDVLAHSVIYSIIKNWPLVAHLQESLVTWMHIVIVTKIHHILDREHKKFYLPCPKEIKP